MAAPARPTDLKTGETRIETVSAEIKGKGLKHLVEVMIDVGGKSAGRSAHCAILRAWDRHGVPRADVPPLQGSAERRPLIRHP